MRKIIFLDIDGVLNSNFWNENHHKEISDGTLIDMDKITLLSKLVHATDAEIVLHSGWKFWFDANLQPLRKEAERLKSMLEQEGVYISDVTPDCTTEEIRKAKKFSLVKAEEILTWLSAHDEVSHWIVIDDLDLHNVEIAKWQIKTDSAVGLTEEDVAEAKRLLGEL